MCRHNEYGVKPTDKAKSTEPFEENKTEASHDRVDEIIDGMRLNDRQKTILDYYMEGFGVSEISRRMKIETSTVWRNRIKLQMKYVAFMGV
jgi:DNA-binding NarL/FixJ family response regulator